MTFDVLESFGPGIDKRISVRTGLGGGDCGFPFEPGGEYVVWTYEREDGSLSTSICSRTQLAEYAKEDLDFLRSVPTLANKAWIFGDAKELTHDPAYRPKTELSIMMHRYPPEEEYRAVRPLADLTVTAVDSKGKKFQSVIDSAGKFRIDPLTPGNYTVMLDLPKGSLLAPRQRKAALPAKQCEEIHFRTAIDGQIRGTLTDVDGKAIDYLRVHLLDIDHPDSPERRFEVSVNGDNTYLFEGLPPGNYLVGVNARGGYSRYETVFYPGVADRAKATVIHLRPAQHVSKIDFVVRRKKTHNEEWAGGSH